VIFTFEFPASVDITTPPEPEFTVVVPLPHGSSVRFQLVAVEIVMPHATPVIFPMPVTLSESSISIPLSCIAQDVPSLLTIALSVPVISTTLASNCVCMALVTHLT
jgi:hypothetical protein